MRKAAPLVLTLWLGILGCGIGDVPAAQVRADAPETQAATSPRRLPPEVAEILRRGPGGPVVHDGIDFGFDDEPATSLRIVLHPSSAPSTRSPLGLR